MIAHDTAAPGWISVHRMIYPQEMSFVAADRELHHRDPPAGFGVNVIGHVTAGVGLGVAARNTISALRAAGVPVAVVDVELPGLPPVDLTHSDVQLADPSAMRLPHPVTVVHTDPESAAAVWRTRPTWFEHTLNAIVPFWELPTVPESWVPLLDTYDALLAPTRHIANAIINVSRTRVYDFPMVATVDGTDTAARPDFEIPEDKVVFAATWDTNSGAMRKNGVGVLRAFAAALAFGADAMLVVKLTNPESAPDPLLARELQRIPPGRVQVISDYLPHGRVLSLYAACDAFVSLHRAEGLGLAMQEAMLLGKPVIATAWSGNMDFMDDTCALLVDFTFTPVRDNPQPYAAPTIIQPQVWAEPDRLDAAQKMHRLATDPALRERLGLAAKELIEQRQATWLATSLDLLARLYESHASFR
jgi:hypothetical protein